MKLLKLFLEELQIYFLKKKQISLLPCFVVDVDVDVDVDDVD